MTELTRREEVWLRAVEALTIAPRGMSWPAGDRMTVQDFADEILAAFDRRFPTPPVVVPAGFDPLLPPGWDPDKTEVL